VIESVSRTLAEQRQLEIRLEALERANNQIRDEVALLFEDESDAGGVGLALSGNWLRVGLVALLLVIAAIASVPYLLDWWPTFIPPWHG
jgi:hypothetical protein